MVNYIDAILSRRESTHGYSLWIELPESEFATGCKTKKWLYYNDSLKRVVAYVNANYARSQQALLVQKKPLLIFTIMVAQYPREPLTHHSCTLVTTDQLPLKVQPSRRYWDEYDLLKPILKLK